MGEAHDIVGELNKLTRKVVSRKFTDTEFGSQFEDFAVGKIKSALLRAAKFIGLPLTAATAEEIARNVADVARARSTAVSRDVVHGAAHEIERLVTRETHSTNTDAIARRRRNFRGGSDRSCNLWRGGRSCARRC